MTGPCDPSPAAGPPGADVEVAAWAASGAMWLTGPASAPLGPPAGFVPKLWAIARLAADRASALGGRIEVGDPLPLLGQRAALSGLSRHGDVSCGGATHLLPARDGWVAVSLARPSDVGLVPAWLGLDGTGDVDDLLRAAGGETGRLDRDAGGERDRPHRAAGGETGRLDGVWRVVAAHVAASPAGPLIDRGRLLGLPVAVLPPAPPRVIRARPPLADLPLRAVAAAGPRATPGATLAGLRVVDLSSLWAGPLAGALLAEAGADVVKVESTGRPDGARGGPAAFFDLLNGAKRSVALDLRSDEGARLLRELLARADVVIEASRPRALEQLGVDAADLLAHAQPRVWVSLTGHGRTHPQRDWTGFGDDAAVAGGLVCWHEGRPCFCADAVADPTSGLVAAAGVLDALAAGGRWLLDVAMSGVAAHLAGPTLPTGPAPPRVVPPRAEAPAAHAPPLGAHTGTVLAELGIAR